MSAKLIVCVCVCLGGVGAGVGVLTKRLGLCYVTQSRNIIWGEVRFESMRLYVFLWLRVTVFYKYILKTTIITKYASIPQPTKGRTSLKVYHYKHNRRGCF